MGVAVGSLVCAEDASAAVREEVRIAWPPQAIGTRLIVVEGREIFGQRKADGR